MDVKEKLVELLDEIQYQGNSTAVGVNYVFNSAIADHLIAHGVMVQEHGYWETVVEVRDNTVCGDGVMIEYKRCSCCKNPAKFWGDDFCGHCGAKLDLPQPPKEMPEETVYCKDCENLMFSDCYGECAKGHKGIVNPNDTCEHAKRKPPKGE